MWDRSKLFLKKMGGIILVGSVVVWCLTAFPRQVSFTMDYDAEIERIEQAYQAFQPAPGTELLEKIQGQKNREIQQLKTAQAAERAEKSLMGRIGMAIAPFFEPLGIEWKGGVALLTGFVAKEIVVSTLGVLYAADDASEPDALKKAL